MPASLPRPIHRMYPPHAHEADVSSSEGSIRYDRSRPGGRRSRHRRCDAGSRAPRTPPGPRASRRDARGRDRPHRRQPRLRWHLGERDDPVDRPDDEVASELRDLLDEHLVEGMTLADAGRIVHASPAQLVRCFSRAFGIAPHRYLLARRIDAARRRLLDGEPVAQVATGVGFHDQAHLTRHFKRHVGTTPASYASATRALADRPSELPVTSTRAAQIVALEPDVTLGLLALDEFDLVGDQACSESANLLGDSISNPSADPEPRSPATRARARVRSRRDRGG